jgi:hypothetical protein
MEFVPNYLEQNFPRSSKQFCFLGVRPALGWCKQYAERKRTAICIIRSPSVRQDQNK